MAARVEAFQCLGQQSGAGFRGGAARVRLVGAQGRGHKAQLGELQVIEGQAGELEVTVMRRIEGSAEQSDAHYRLCPGVSQVSGFGSIV